MHRATRGCIENEQNTAVLCCSGNRELAPDQQSSEQQLCRGSGLTSGGSLGQHKSRQEVSRARTDSPTLSSLINSSSNCSVGEPSLSSLASRVHTNCGSSTKSPTLSELAVSHTGQQRSMLGDLISSSTKQSLSSLSPFSTLTKCTNPRPNLSQLSKEHGCTVTSRPTVPSLDDLMSGQPAQPSVPSLSELMSSQPAQPSVPSLSELMSGQPAQPSVPSLSDLMSGQPAQPSVPSLSELMSSQPAQPSVPSLSELMSGQPAQPSVPSLSELMSGQPAQPSVPSLSELMSGQPAQPSVPSLSDLMSGQPAQPSVPSLSELMSSQPAQPSVPSLSELMSGQPAQPSVPSFMSSQPSQPSLSLLATTQERESSARLDGTNGSKKIAPFVPVFEGETSGHETTRSQPSLSDLVSKHVAGTVPMSHKETHPPTVIPSPHLQQMDFVFKPLNARDPTSTVQLSLADLARARGTKETTRSGSKAIAPSPSLTLSDLAKRQTNAPNPSLLTLGQDASLLSLNQRLCTVTLSKQDSRIGCSIDFQKPTSDSVNTRSFRLMMTRQSGKGRVQKLTSVLRQRVLFKLAKNYKKLILFNFSTPSPDDTVREKQEAGFRRKV